MFSEESTSANLEDETKSNPIIDAFKKMMEEERNTEYEKYFQTNVENQEDFYDGDADFDDEKEIMDELKTHFIDKPIESDAILNCPACMVTLTIDCQQHEVYKHQFRAMFVDNCRTDERESIICPIVYKNNKNASSNKPEDVFHPVYCKICQTKVGMIDHKSVYHFFNVLPSD